MLYRFRSVLDRSRQRRGLHLLDSVDNRKLPSTLLSPDSSVIPWYSCGPTVYDETHVGHARAYVSIDILQRAVQHLTGRRVQSLLGMTDVDDKIIAGAKQRGMDPRALAQKYEAEFHENMRALGVQPPAAVLRVSEHIPEIVAMAGAIQRHGFAYQGAKSKSLYFDIGAFEAKLTRYEKLVPSCHHADGEQPTHQPPAADAQHPLESEKRNPKDFVLWKARAPDAQLEHPSCLWDSPWGVGRPGWHIECSAMCHAAVGRELAVHAGGIDLAFPHHANEIAQTVAFHNDASLQWPRCFLHVGHVHIHGQKMSKSLKNFTSVAEFLRAHSADAFRLFCLQNHYRSPVEYSAERMAEADNLLARYQQAHRLIDSTRMKDSPLASTKWADHEHQLWRECVASQSKVEASLRDDFDTPAALASVFQLIHSLFSYLALPRVPNRFLLCAIQEQLFTLWHQVFGFPQKSQTQMEASTLSHLVQIREEIRTMASSSSNPMKKELFTISDKMRDILKPHFEIVDRK